MYIDKKTGVLSVDMMWSCVKCSFAYNKVEAVKCEVCNAERAQSSKPTETALNGDFQLIKGERENGDVQAEIKEWICKRCTLENPGQALTCLACGGSKLKSSASSSLKEETATSSSRKSTSTSALKRSWSCPKCTLKNSSDVNKCKVCDSVRIRTKTSTTSTINNNNIVNRCHLCTFENSVGSKKCEMCGHSLGKESTGSGGGSKKPSVPEVNLAAAAASAAASVASNGVLVNSRPSSTTSMGSRHESELMEQLRKVEESAARDKWRNIVQFCKEVR